MTDWHFEDLICLMTSLERWQFIIAEDLHLNLLDFYLKGLVYGFDGLKHNLLK